MTIDPQRCGERRNGPTTAHFNTTECITCSDGAQNPQIEVFFEVPYDNITDHERKLIGEELYKLVPDPEYMDYVFHPKEDLPISDTIDKAIEKAFQYKPIAL